MSASRIVRTPERSVARRARLFAPALIVALAAASGAHLVAQSRLGTAAASAAGNQNFDIRRDDQGGDYMRRLTGPAANPAAGALAANRIVGVALLKGQNDAVDVEVSAELGTLEVVTARRGAGFLTARTSDRAATLRGFLSSYSPAYGLSPQQVSSLELVADYVNPAGNMAWVEFEQRINGLPVFGGMIRGAFTANNELAATTGTLASGVEDGTVPREPAIAAVSAVARATSFVGWNVAEAALAEKASEDRGQRLVFAGGGMARDAKAWLVYFPLAAGVARLAWATQIVGNPDGFLIVTDAEDGTLLFRKNLTNYQTQSATYNVYTSDRPAPASPSPALPGMNFQAPFVARGSVTLIGNEAPNTFNNLGWMTDGTNGTNGATTGNNVIAGMDLSAPDGLDFIIGGSGRAFVFSYDPS